MKNRKDCTPDAEIPTQFTTPVKKTRKYTGPAKGSAEAKERMARVRAAQWAKNGLVVSSDTVEKDGDRDGNHAPIARNQAP